MIWALVALFAGQFETTFHDGLIALNQNNLAAAETQLRSAAELQPKNGRVWLALAQTYWKLQRPLETEAAVRNAETWGAGDAVVSKALGVFYLDAGENYYFEVSQAHLQRQEFAAAL